MKRISKNIYIRAFNKMILFFGYLHIFLLFLIAFKNGSLQSLNTFFILDLHLLLPGITQGIISLVLSLIVLVVVYSFSLFLTQKENAK